MKATTVLLFILTLCLNSCSSWDKDLKIAKPESKIKSPTQLIKTNSKKQEVSSARPVMNFI